jgi:anhydro-N-acetylmuramic acid kinase
MKTYKVIGLMSGTSLDGVDLAYCEFNYDKSWHYRIVCAETIEYSQEWIVRLSKLMSSYSLTLVRIHSEYGRYLGELAKDFIDRNNLSPDFIASHGHTIFHQPELGFTLQIGNGNSISSVTGLPVVFDFRSLDVALGGQGAPLVPIGDRLLFKDYDYCLNLGGIANISFEKNAKRIAFDICPVNIALNSLANLVGQKYDLDGILASSSKINKRILEQLNSLNYYKKDPPKSLGREWINLHFLPLIKECPDSPKIKLRTVTEHITSQIASVVNSQPQGKLLATGGGARNKFLIELLKTKIDSEVIVPEHVLIDFKEALIFAFLGVLRWRNEINTLSSVTGANKDSSSGLIVHY